MNCLSLDQIRRFLEAPASGPPAGQVIAHLLDCADCRRRAATLVAPGEAAPASAKVVRHPSSAAADSFAAMFGRCRERVLGALREVEGADGLLASLLRQPRERRRLVVEQRRFWSPAVVERLLGESRERKFGDPGEAVELAELALAILDHLDPDLYGGRFLDEARGRAWTAVGAGHRWAGDLAPAEAAFARAGRLLAECADPIAVGMYLHFLAGLRIDQRRFGEGRAHLRRAIELYREGGDEGRVARALTTLGTSYTDEGDPAESLPLLLDALERVDEQEDPRTAHYARHSLAVTLVELGETEQAVPLAAACRRWAEANGDRYLGVRGGWLEGLIASARGEAPRAEALLRATRDRFAEQEMPYDAALVALDLAELLAGQGRLVEIRDLARHAAAAFLDDQIHREAAGALGLLCRATEEERASAALVAAVARFVRRARFQPGARFDREA